MSRTLVPMPEGLIVHTRLLSDGKHWRECVWIVLRNGWDWRHPVRSLRKAIYRVNHGTRHDGTRYRQCFRMKWLEWGN